MKSSITSHLSLDQGTVTFTQTNESDIDKDFLFTVPNGTNLSGLTGTYSLARGGQVVLQGSFPPEGTRFVCSDQDYVHIDASTLSQGAEYSLEVSYTFDGQTYSNTFTFSGDPPESPYPSWVFDGEAWQPPVEHPISGVGMEDTDIYTWDEQNLIWVPLAGYALE